MRKILSSRIFRILVCLVLVCCFLVNSSPIKAKAVVVELTAAQLLKWGIVAMVTLMTCGVVFQIQNEYELQALGRTYYNHAHSAASAAERLDDLEVMSQAIDKAYDSKVIPFRTPSGDDGGIWKTLLLVASISFLDMFLRLNPEPVFYDDPSYSTLEQGSTFSHHILYDDGSTSSCNDGVIYTATAPVVHFTLCNNRFHYDVFCSSESFVLKESMIGNRFNSRYSSSDGVDFYWQYLGRDYSSGNTEFSYNCTPTTYSILEDTLKDMCARVAVGGVSEIELYPSLTEGDLQEDFDLVGDTHILEIPDIDFSSMSSEQDIIDIANKVISGEMTYEDLLNQFTAGVAPSVVPDTESEPGTSTDPDPGTGEPGTGTDPDSGSSSWQPPSDPTQFQLVDLSKFFPFCIPFDLFEFFKLLNSDPVAPVLHWEIQDLAGQTYSLTVDLSEWDSVALLFRRLQLFLFVTGLAAASRKFIKW